MRLVCQTIDDTKVLVRINKIDRISLKHTETFMRGEFKEGRGKKKIK